MVDKSLPDANAHRAHGSSDTASVREERRAFLQRAALIGLPVVLATVRPRTVWAQEATGSSAASANPSTTTQ